MEHQGTKEQSPSLTFMPRAMEIESYTDEERWRRPGADETFLDPSSPLFPKEELERQKREPKPKRREALRQKRKCRKDNERGIPEKGGGADIDQNRLEPDEEDDDSVSSFTSDSEYDEEYQAELRSKQVNVNNTQDSNPGVMTL